MGSRNPLYIVVFRASLHVQMIPSERDLLKSIFKPSGISFLCGLNKVKSEWTVHCSAHDLLKVYKATA